MDLKGKTPEDRAEILIEVFGLKFRRQAEWGCEPRINTTWGTKTRREVTEVIKRIMFSEEEGK